MWTASHAPLRGHRRYGGLLLLTVPLNRTPPASPRPQPQKENGNRARGEHRHKEPRFAFPLLLF